MMASSQGGKKKQPFADDYELPFEYKASSNLSKSMSNEIYLIDFYILEGFATLVCWFPPKSLRGIHCLSLCNLVTGSFDPVFSMTSLT